MTIMITMTVVSILLFIIRCSLVGKVDKLAAVRLACS